MAGGYPDLVKPEVPNAQSNRAPDLLLEGLRTGLAAFAQFAQIRRQQESDVARLALQERMSQESHALERQKLDQAAELIPSQIAANEAHASMMTEQGKAYFEGTATAAQLKQEADKQKKLLFNEVEDNIKTLKLDDVHFQTKEPMGFAKNVIEFRNMYHLSPLPEVRKAIKDYQDIADSQKLYIRHGQEDETGAIKPTGNGRQVPAWRIVLNAQNPDTRDQTLRDLEASGYTQMVSGFQDFTDKSGKKVSVPTTTKTLREPVKAYMQEAQANDPPLPAATDAPVDASVDSAGAPAPTPKAMPDYGPEPTAKQYPVGTKGKIGGQWFTLTTEGWKPAVP